MERCDSWDKRYHVLVMLDATIVRHVMKTFGIICQHLECDEDQQFCDGS